MLKKKHLLCTWPSHPYAFIDFLLHSSIDYHNCKTETEGIKLAANITLLLKWDMRQTQKSFVAAVLIVKVSPKLSVLAHGALWYKMEKKMLAQ